MSTASDIRSSMGELKTTFDHLQAFGVACVRCDTLMGEVEELRAENVTLKRKLMDALGITDQDVADNMHPRP